MSNETLSRSIFDCLFAQIGDGRLESGTVIRESDLVRLFNVSRAPVSSAIKNLIDEGLLIKRQTQGYVVAGEFQHELKFSKDSLTIPKDVIQKFDRQPSWEKIYDSIEAELVAVMPFGSFKINESSMTEYYGVNRSIIQQVITRLCERGIAEKQSQSQCNLLVYDEAFITDRYELRQLLEPEALKRAAPFIKPKEIINCLDMHLNVENNFHKLAKTRLPNLENQLHIDLIAKCPNARVLVALRGAQTPLITTTKMIRRVLGNSLEEPLLAEHLAVIKSLADGDSDHASKMLKEHLQQSCLRSVERLPLLAKLPRPQVPSFLKNRTDS